MQRALAAALLTRGASKIYNAGHSNDDKAAIEIIKSLGAELKMQNKELIVTSTGIYPRQKRLIVANLV
jgi:3-phosphoshikimate 1-carboxyvinyltransferase